MVEFNWGFRTGARTGAWNPAGYPQCGRVFPGVNVIRGTGRNADFPHVQPSKKGEDRRVFQTAPERGVGNTSL